MSAKKTCSLSIHESATHKSATHVLLEVELKQWAIEHNLNLSQLFNDVLRQLKKQEALEHD